MATPEYDIEDITLQIEASMEVLVNSYADEKCWITHYGANDIHPKNLVYQICVQTDEERNKLHRNVDLMKALRQLLITHNYPASGRDGVYINYESQETVDRDSHGNWRHHWQ